MAEIWGAVIGAAGAIGGSMLSSSASSRAAGAQNDAAMAGINEQRRQFDSIQQLLQPYVGAGTSGLNGQMDLLGLNGTDRQGTAVSALQNSPMFTSMLQQGTNSILSNASATGGLRGGNTQSALAQFSPTLLSQVINDQYSRLGGLTSIGQNAAAGVGNAGMATGNAITGLYGQMGAAQAGNALAQGRAGNSLINGLGQAAGAYAGYNGFGGAGQSWQRYTGSGNYAPGGQTTSDGYANYFGAS